MPKHIKKKAENAFRDGDEDEKYPLSGIMAKSVDEFVKGDALCMVQLVGNFSVVARKVGSVCYARVGYRNSEELCEPVN